MFIFGKISSEESEGVLAVCYITDFNEFVQALPDDDVFVTIDGTLTTCKKGDITFETVLTEDRDPPIPEGWK